MNRLRLRRALLLQKGRPHHVHAHQEEFGFPVLKRCFHEVTGGEVIQTEICSREPCACCSWLYVVSDTTIPTKKTLNSAKNANSKPLSRRNPDARRRCDIRASCHEQRYWQGALRNAHPCRLQDEQCYRRGLGIGCVFCPHKAISGGQPAATTTRPSRPHSGTLPERRPGTRRAERSARQGKGRSGARRSRRRRRGRGRRRPEQASRGRPGGRSDLIEDRLATHLMECWTTGRTSLRRPLS